MPTEDQHGDQQDDQDGHGDPEHLHPARHSRGAVAVGARAGVVVGVGVGGWISHVRLLSCYENVNVSRHDVYVKTNCFEIVVTYTRAVPRLWNETIQAHRHEVREAILDTTWALVTEHGLTSVTMSQIAQDTGIGRATLYKYFPDVEAILVAWHDRHIAAHLAHLHEVSNQAGDAGERLKGVLEAYALISHHSGNHATELHALLHRYEHVDRAQQQLVDLIRRLLAEVAQAGDLRGEVPLDELASYCLHALSAARHLPSEAAVRRLVTVTLAGLYASTS